MERLTLSQRFAGISLVDDDDDDGHNNDDDIVAMRQIYLLYSNNDQSYMSASQRPKLTSNVHNKAQLEEILVMQSDWKNHYQRLIKKCSMLDSGIFNCNLYDGLHDDIVPDSSVRSGFDDISNDKDDDVGELISSTEHIVETANEFVSDRSKATSICDKQITENYDARNEVALPAEVSAIKDVESDISSVVESVDNEKSQVAEYSDKTVKSVSKSSHKTVDNNKKGPSFDNTPKTKPAVKKKEQKVVKKFDIKPSSSFPLDELLPLNDKPSKAADEKQTAEKVPKVASEDNNAATKKNGQESQYFENEYGSTEDCFHGSVFDYIPAVDETKPDISANTIITTSSFLESGLIRPDRSGFDMPGCRNNINNDISLRTEEDNSSNQYLSTFLSSYDHGSPRNSLSSESVLLQTSISQSAMSKNIERNQIIQSTLDEIGRCNSIELCEVLLGTLTEQCSGLATSDEDRLTLEAMIQSLRLKVIDASMYMDETNSLSNNTPLLEAQENVVGPSGDSSTPIYKNMEIFEGRTLLKGGVEPRRIPKTNVNKLYQERPCDPRLAVSDYCSKCSYRLPMPKFSVDLFGEKCVKKMIHLDWESYKGKVSAVKDPRRDQTLGDIDDNRHETKPADSIKCTLETGNIQISLQESFMGVNPMSSGPEMSMLMKLHNQNLLHKIMKDRDEMKANSESSDSRKVSQDIDKQLKTKHSLIRKNISGAPLKSECNIQHQRVDITSQDDWEEGQLSTDSDSAIDKLSAKNKMRGKTINDRKDNVSRTKIDHQKGAGTPPVEIAYDIKRRTSISSVTSSTSRSSETLVQNKTKSISSDKRPEHSSNVKRPDHSSSLKRPEHSSTRDKYHSQSKLDSNIVHKIKSSNSSYRKTEYDNEIPISSRKKTPSHDASPLSSDHSQPTIRRRHKTTHDGSIQVTVIQEPSHTMKRCHSLEEVGRKRHKSGDMLSDNTNNKPISDHYKNKATPISDHYSNKTTPISDHYKNKATPISDHYSKKTTPFSDNYSNKTTPISDHYSNKTTPISDHYSNKTTPISDHYSNKTTPISDHYSDKTTPISDHYSNKTTPISNQYYKNNTLITDQYNKTSSPILNQYNPWTKQTSNNPYAQQKVSPIFFETTSSQSNKPSVHNRLGWNNVYIPSNTVKVHTPQPSQIVSQHEYGQYNASKVTGTQSLTKQASKPRVQERLGQLNISKQSDSRTISQTNYMAEQQLKTASFYTKEQSKIPKIEIKLKTSEKCFNKYEDEAIIDSKETLKPSVKNSVPTIRRRKSLEEQQKEIEQDKQFLEQFKMKIANKK